MPRTLPWLAGASKKNTKRSSPAPRQSRKRSSSPDRLVNSDLEDVDPSPRNAATKKRRRREPSSSPPPNTTAPEVAYMNEGLKADDIFVMVEDEFYSTAQLFTAPLHRAAYDRLRRLHRSRGAETLANLERATDKTSKPSTALRRKMEAEEKAKRRRGKSAPEEESDDDDEYMAVPELAGLMTSSQIVSGKTGLENLSKAKSNTRAAAGFSQSPHKGKKTKDVFANTRMSPLREDESTDDDDDLDRGTTSRSRAYDDMDSSSDEPRASIEKPPQAKSTSSGFFRQFAKVSDPEHAMALASRKQQDSLSAQDHSVSRKPSSTPTANGFLQRRVGGGKGSRMAELLAKRKQQSTQDPEPPMVPGQRFAVTTKSIKQESSPQSIRMPPPTVSETARENKSSEYLAQRKAVREKKAAEEKSKNTRRDDIPTFLF